VKTSRSVARALVLAVLLAVTCGVGLRAESRSIDTERSQLTVYVYKSGVFSAFADNHVIRAPIAVGSLANEPPLSVSLTVHAAELRVLDPNLAPARRAEVQARMVGPEVLDASRYPEIEFASTAVEAREAGELRITGRLTLHGQTRPVVVVVAARDGVYRGSVMIKQRDFGIQPVAVAGGAVKVKDELKIEFAIVPR